MKLAIALTLALSAPAFAGKPIPPPPPKIEPPWCIFPPLILPAVKPSRTVLPSLRTVLPPPPSDMFLEPLDLDDEEG